MSVSSQAGALTLRYGNGAEPAAGPWNEVIATLVAHRSIRGFLPDALPPGNLETLIAAAQSASTSSNLQTWSVVSVTDQTTRSRLAKIANNQKHIEQCPLFLVWLADVSRNERLGVEEDVVLETIPHFETYWSPRSTPLLPRKTRPWRRSRLVYQWFISAHYETIHSRWADCSGCLRARWGCLECVSDTRCRPSPTKLNPGSLSPRFCITKPIR